MFRTIFLLLSITCTAYNTYAFSSEHINMSMGSSYPINLLVNEPYPILNRLMWTLKASCTIVSPNESNLLSVHVLKKSVSVNKEPLLAGNNMDYTVFNNDILELEALPGAQAELINVGEEDVVAMCSLL